jgi:hypothetical protein
MSTKKIREFIFLDRNKLYSLYSQVYEGVAERIVESYSEGYSDTNSSSSSGDLDERIAEATQKTESRVLYDHMFDRLTEKLSPSILNPGPLSTGNYKDILENKSLVEVTGDLRVGDYKSARELIEIWDEFSELITLTSLVEAGISVEEYENAVDKILDLRQRLVQEGDPNEAARIQAQLESYQPANDILHRQQEMFMPESVQNLLKMVIDLFYENQYEANLSRENDSGIRFRAPLSRESLRENHDILRTTYAGDKLGEEWTIIGSIAFIPEEDFQVEDLENVEIDEDPDSVRGGLTSFQKGIDVINRAALQSADTVEIHLAPLAIYREYEIEVSNEGTEVADE